MFERLRSFLADKLLSFSIWLNGLSVKLFRKQVKATLFEDDFIPDNSLYEKWNDMAGTSALKERTTYPPYFDYFSSPDEMFSGFRLANLLALRDFVHSQRFVELRAQNFISPEVVENLRARVENVKSWHTHDEALDTMPDLGRWK